MKLKAIIIGFLSLLILILVIWVWTTNRGATPTIIVGTSTESAGTLTTNFQRKTFYADGYHWVFYCNGSQILYTTSSDAQNWKAPTLVRAGGSSSGISIWYDENVHYAYAGGARGTPVLYRRGSIIGDRIQWEDERTVSEGFAEREYYNAYVTVDSHGYPWVSYLQIDVKGVGVPEDRSAYVVKAISTDGSTWNNPFRISQPITTTFWRTSILPFNNGRLYAIYATSIEVKGRLWNGSAWENEETITTTDLQQDYGYSAVSHNDNIHMVLLENQTNNILYFNRTSESGWSGGEIVQESQGPTSFPILTVDETNGNLYCFWIHNNVIYMKKCVGGAWESPPDTPFGTTFDSPMWVSSFYKVWNGKIGVAWLEGREKPFAVKYKFLEASSY